MTIRDAQIALQDIYAWAVDQGPLAGESPMAVAMYARDTAARIAIEEDQPPEVPA